MGRNILKNDTDLKCGIQVAFCCTKAFCAKHIQYCKSREAITVINVTLGYSEVHCKG